MPLGVSEGLIEKAYGPIDYSGFYKGLDAAAKRMAAEEKAAADAAKKEYALNIANFNKSNTGVRAIDAPEVSQLWSEYSNIRKQQIANPNLFKKNPTKYAELEDAASKKQAELNTLIQGSKELNKLSPEFKKRALNPTTRSEYDVDAEKLWIENVDNKKYKDVVTNDFQNESKYFRKDVDATKFYDNLGNDVLKKAVTEPIITKKEVTEDGIPVVYKTKFNQFPDIEKVRNVVESNLNSYFKVSGQKQRVIDQEINNLTKTGEVDKTLKRWNDLKDADFKSKYGVEKPKNLVDANGQMITGASKEEQLVKLLTMKNYLDFLPTRGEDLKPEIPESYRLKWMARQRALGRRTAAQPISIDVRPTFEAITKGGPAFKTVALPFIENINNTNAIGATAALIINPSTAISSQDKEIWKDSEDILGDAFKKGESKDPNKAIQRLNELNKASGIYSKISLPNYLSGKIIALRWVDKDVQKFAFFDTQDKDAARRMNQLLKSSIYAKKQTGQEVSEATQNSDPLGLGF
jgi:hypothetical protein